ncbi:alcohol dehydrogenase catalytic domain-containing protein, partial [Arthrospira platensis SPKY1]|nr:alcohol dehydrogenase catalytic domain-containing protein [Arthrospira platensis SPKY1]
MSTSTARAMVLEHCRPAEDRPLHLRPWPVPAPGPGEITMEVLACGVCRTDLHTVEGDLDLPRLPTVPGHQVIGRVTALGPGADSGLLGRVVGVAWMAGACGNCPL